MTVAHVHAVIVFVVSIAFVRGVVLTALSPSSIMNEITQTKYETITFNVECIIPANTATKPRL
jgi:hypothetical protein